MMIRSVKIIWKNYLDMAEDAGKVQTDKRFRCFHGAELETLQRCYPELVLKDDYFTDIDEAISRSLGRILPTAEVSTELIYPWDYEGIYDETIMWTLSGMHISDQVLLKAVSILSEEYPKVDFKIIIGNLKRARGIIFAKNTDVQVYLPVSSENDKNRNQVLCDSLLCTKVDKTE